MNEEAISKCCHPQEDWYGNTMQWLSLDCIRYSQTVKARRNFRPSPILHASAPGGGERGEGDIGSAVVLTLMTDDEERLSVSLHLHNNGFDTSYNIQIAFSSKSS